MCVFLKRRNCVAKKMLTITRIDSCFEIAPHPVLRKKAFSLFVIWADFHLIFVNCLGGSRRKYECHQIKVCNPFICPSNKKSRADPIGYDKSAGITFTARHITNSTLVKIRANDDSSPKRSNGSTVNILKLLSYQEICLRIFLPKSPPTQVSTRVIIRSGHL